MQPLDSSLAALLSSIPYKGLTLVHLGYEKKVLSKEGFGYLIPSCEKEEVLGVLFESSLFPKQNRRAEETRLTVILPSTTQAPEKAALAALLSHLKIRERPSFLKISQAASSIPQYPIGHLEVVQRIESSLLRQWPNMYLVGSYLEGVSVNDCMKRAQKIALQIGP